MAIYQISHSKKWKSSNALDENDKPLVDKNGKSIYLKSYSVLQDKFFEYMQEAGFKGFERGERDSDAEKRRELNKANRRTREIDSIIQKLHEDNSGKDK